MRVSDHYFSAQPDSASNSRTFTVNLRGIDIDVTSHGGVFSHGHIDKGTAVLLDKAPLTQLPTPALAVDLGCGWGPLTLALALEYPDAAVLGVDVNERALDLARQNTASMPNVMIEESNVALDRLRNSEDRIDLLWSNPPIRIGKEALHTLLKNWLSLLADDGIAYLVVQRNLGSDSLSAWLNTQGFESAKYGSSKGFRILQVRHSATPAGARDHG